MPKVFIIYKNSKHSASVPLVLSAIKLNRVSLILCLAQDRLCANMRGPSYWFAICFQPLYNFFCCFGACRNINNCLIRFFF